jgi:hypothetical protein
VDEGPRYTPDRASTFFSFGFFKKGKTYRSVRFGVYQLGGGLQHTPTPPPADDAAASSFFVSSYYQEENIQIKS